MRSLLKLAALFLLPLALFSWFFWPTPYAYRTVEHSVIRIHRFTGRADILRNTGWAEMKPAVQIATPAQAVSDSTDCNPPKNPDGTITIDPLCLDAAPAKPAAQK